MSKFEVSFNDAQKRAFEINVANGFWVDRDGIMSSAMPGATCNVALACLALIGSEVSEGVEAVRKHPQSTWSDADTKDTLVRELAGTVIRCMDMAERFNLPLARAIIVEIEANAKRGFMHGGKAA